MIRFVKVKFGSGQPKSKLASVSIVAIGFTLAFIARLFTQIITASRFGASGIYDAYNVAMVLPSLLVLVLAGSLDRVLLPIIADAKVKQGDSGREEIINSIIVLLGILLIVFVIANIVIAPWIIPLLIPGLKGTVSNLTINLSRILFVSLIPIGLISISTTSYYIDNRFSLPTLADVCRAFIYLLGALILAKVWGIYGLAIGFVASAFGKLILLGRPLIVHRLRLKINFKNPAMVALLKLWISIIVVQILAQTYPLFDQYYGSLIGVGAISYLAYASALAEIPSSLLGYSIGLVYFPDLSREVASNNMVQVKEILLSAFRLIILLGIPTVLIVIILREPLIRVFLQRGKFGVVDTFNTATMLLFYSGYALGGMIGNVTSRVIWAFKDWVFTLVLSSINLTLYILCIGSFVQYLGKEGIALTTSVVFSLSWIMQLVYIRFRVGSFDMRKRLPSITKYSICNIFFILGSLASYRIMQTFLTKPGIVTDVVTMAVVCIAGYIFLLLSAWLFKLKLVVDALDRFLMFSKQIWATSQSIS